MEISKMNILETIEKMVAAGKNLPQRDRIRFAKDPAAEEAKVLDQTVNLWWELFSKQHIGVSIWEKATDRAMILNGIAKLETSIINPALMSVALAQLEKEHMEEQRVKYEQEKKEDRAFNCVVFPEIGRLVAYHMANHLRPLLELPDADEVRQWAGPYWAATTIEKNMIKLRVYYCYYKHAERDRTKMPIRIALDENKVAHIGFVD